MKSHRAAALALLALLVLSGSLGSADAKKAKAKRASKKAAKAADGADFVIAGEYFRFFFESIAQAPRSLKSLRLPLFPPGLASFCFLAPHATDRGRLFCVDRYRWKET